MECNKILILFLWREDEYLLFSKFSTVSIDYFTDAHVCVCTRGTLPPKPWNLFIESCVLILTWSNCSHLGHTLRSVHTPVDTLSPRPRTAFELMDFDAVYCLRYVFVSPFPHRRNISL